MIDPNHITTQCPTQCVICGLPYAKIGRYAPNSSMDFLVCPTYEQCQVALLDSRQREYWYFLKRISNSTVVWWAYDTAANPPVCSIDFGDIADIDYTKGDKSIQLNYRLPFDVDMKMLDIIRAFQ